MTVPGSRGQPLEAWLSRPLVPAGEPPPLLLGPATDFAGTCPQKAGAAAIGLPGAAAVRAIEAAYLPDPAMRDDWRCAAGWRATDRGCDPECRGG